MKDDKIANMEQPIGSLTIGDFTISDYTYDTLWIQRSGGEGGQFKIALFEKAVEKFYNEHF